MRKNLIGTALATAAALAFVASPLTSAFGNDKQSSGNLNKNIVIAKNKCGNNNCNTYKKKHEHKQKNKHHKHKKQES